MALFDDFKDIYNESEWAIEPVTFREFCETHFNIFLTETQYSWFYDLVGEDPKKIFKPDNPRKKHIRAILAGKGSGKDLGSSLFQNYIFYLLLCLKNPTTYFNLPGPEENVDVVNVGQTQSQSIKVFFKRFTDRLKRWKWLLDNFNVYDRGKLLNPGVGNPIDDIWILTSSVTCTKNPVRFHSLHSASQSYEGLNILMFTLDEGSAFPEYVTYDKDGNPIERSTADDILDVVKSSAESRNWDWFGILISYPRRPNCFQMRKYREGLEPDSDILSGKYKQWDCLPANKYSGKWVEWEGYLIPEERLKTAKANPADFKLKYLCETEDTVAKYFNKDYVRQVFQHGRKFIGVFNDDIKETDIGRKYIYKYLDHWEEMDQLFDEVMAGDYSTVNDRTSLALGHGEPVVQTDPALKGYDKKVVIDLILVWQPDKKKGILVSHGSIKECVTEILHALNVSYATLDQLESALALETLADNGINSDKHNVNDDDYIRLKTLVDAGLLECPLFQLLEDEMNCVQFYPKRGRGGRIDHPANGSKDVLDTICNIARVIYTKQINVNISMETLNFQDKSAGPLIDANIGVDDWSSLIPGY